MQEDRVPNQFECSAAPLKFERDNYCRVARNLFFAEFLPERLPDFVCVAAVFQRPQPESPKLPKAPKAWLPNVTDCEMLNSASTVPAAGHPEFVPALHSDASQGEKAFKVPCTMQLPDFHDVRHSQATRSPPTFHVFLEGHASDMHAFSPLARLDRPHASLLSLDSEVGCVFLFQGTSTQSY